MAKKTRKKVHVSVELNIDVDLPHMEVRKFVKDAIDQYRASLPQSTKLASTLPVTILAYREIA